MTSELRHMVVGLQSSGKSTFVAALWYLLSAGEAATALEKGRHNGDFAYLEELAKRWASVYQLERTKIQQYEIVNINLRVPGNGAEMTLTFSDPSGESYERAFATRLIESHLGEGFSGVKSLMLFVSALDGKDDATIIDMADGLGIASVEHADGKREPEKVFDPSKTPRQVQLVDLLQSFQEEPIDSAIERVVLIVSAWDKTRYTDPDRWLKNKMPLLDQYLKNCDLLFRVYGVSALGGDVPEKNKPDPKPAERQRLLKITKASERIVVVGHGAGKHDLTHPIRWLGGLEPQ